MAINDEYVVRSGAIQEGDCFKFDAHQKNPAIPAQTYAPAAMQRISRHSNCPSNMRHA